MKTRCLAVAAIIGAAALPAWSQGALKPLDALVVNPESRPVPVVDKPLAAAIGALASSDRRTPYQHADRFGQDSANCTQFVCHVDFPAVPAGKLLVVTYASARYASAAAEVYPSVELRVADNLEDAVLLPAPVRIGPVSFVAAGPVTFYVAAGRIPRLALGGNGVGFASNTALASIVGHLIDAPR